MLGNTLVTLLLSCGDQAASPCFPQVSGVPGCALSGFPPDKQNRPALPGACVGDHASSSGSCPAGGLLSLMWQLCSGPAVFVTGARALTSVGGWAAERTFRRGVASCPLVCVSVTAFITETQNLTPTPLGRGGGCWLVSQVNWLQGRAGWQATYSWPGGSRQKATKGGGGEATWGRPSEHLS